MRYFFARLDQKRKLLGNVEKILKIFDENSIENLNFYFIFILENLLVKLEPSEITPFFYSNFFRFRGGGGASPPPPMATPLPGGEKLRTHISHKWDWGRDLCRKFLPGLSKSESGGLSSRFSLCNENLGFFWQGRRRASSELQEVCPRGSEKTSLLMT